ncbi:hypothetical protein O3Q52_35780 [Streptomyces sp. ActVer]|uniref:hypothetical protein n=1 Tax=Streptomyces sp. ActVer TaxID=3014558 RepID=UPI0022B48A5F|nr:hypothetical protein [Streptomyces sp. ActVer]MCZ4513417.1 hypothetical protein [Streptomyces sp. ActVer]
MAEAQESKMKLMADMLRARVNAPRTSSPWRALPEPVADTARDSVAGAHAAAQRLDPSLGTDLANHAAGAFTDALSHVFLTSAAVCLAVATLIALRLPAQPRQQPAAEDAR